MSVPAVRAENQIINYCVEPAQEMSQGATEQAASVEETSSAMEEMSSNIQQNTDNSQQTEKIAQQRIDNAQHYDAGLGRIRGIRIPPRPADFRIVYHLYIVFAEERDALLAHCIDSGIEAKVHYPVPIYRQPALQHLGYREGDFPVADRHTKNIISFPCDQHLSTEEMDHVINTVASFYAR